MAYDELLAGRIRGRLADRTDVVENAMFGGVTFMVAGNMCCGVNRDDLIIHLDAGTALEQLNSPLVRLWDFMKRPMPGMFAVSPAGCASQEMVDHWVSLALTHALSLPPKVKRAAKTRRLRG
jgi:hypothetical protein